MEKTNKWISFVKDPKKLKEKLSDLQYQVTQEDGTERPFTNEFWRHFEAGLYVDIVSGEPLFTSMDKFDSSCGWPAFARPIDENFLVFNEDSSFGMKRTEVRSRYGDSHLGHVFNDGPKELGGHRFCINSASLRFIPLAELESEGYGEYLKFF